MDIESSTHFSLKCPSYINEWCTLMSNLNRINQQISQTSLQLLTNTLFFWNLSYSDKTNSHILNAPIDYIQLTKRSDEPLFWLMLFFSHIYFWQIYQFVQLQVPAEFFFRLRLNFILFYFDYNCKIIVSYLLIVSFNFILLTGGWSMN